MKTAKQHNLPASSARDAALEEIRQLATEQGLTFSPGFTGLVDLAFKLARAWLRGEAVVEIRKAPHPTDEAAQ